MFVQVSGFPDYLVDPSGTVVSMKYGRWKVLKQQLRRDGYFTVMLCMQGKTTRPTVHSLVAAAFIGPRPDGHDVNHKDSNRTNNHVDNLEYMTRSENILHAWNKGRCENVRAWSRINAKNMGLANKRKA